MEELSNDKEELLREKLRLMEKDHERKKSLPHRYGWKNYKWFNEYFDATERTQLLCAANQISKSSSQIRKVIALASEPELWPKYFRQRPKLFWYLYPTATMATTEYRTKWVPDFLPRGEYRKNHPQYGWKEEFRNRGDIFAIHFNSGVSIYFKTYAQDVQSLQAASVDFIACDEELPEELWDEVNMRRNATDGIMSMVFTATLGQDFFRRAIEPRGTDKEVLPDAWKKQVSMFDCQVYDDGTPSHWTTERIHRTISMCKSDAEVQRRVYGKFIKDSGLKYQTFNRSVNVVEEFEIPPSWIRYCGIDLGSGGDTNHPSAISFIAVKPDYQRGVVYKSWRGDDVLTSMTDVANKYLELCGYDTMAASFYDYVSKEFKIITDRMGMSFLPADKGRETGEQVINALFKNKMLDIFNIPANEPLISEIMSLNLGTDKRNAKDDSIDSCRYAVTRIPWDWSIAGTKISVIETIEKRKRTPHEIASIEREADRRRMVANNFQDDVDLGIEKEIKEWADYLDEGF